MHWEGATATAAGPALSWRQLEQLMGSGLCTLGNHTHHHVRPEVLTTAELDASTEAMLERLGV